KLRGFLVGAWTGFTLGERFPVHLRLSAGAMVGAVFDARTGSFTSADGTAYGAGPLLETQPATFLFLTPEARGGLPLTSHVQLWAGLEVPILFATAQVTWNATHPVNAGAHGYGTFPPDTLTGSTVVAVAPGIGARYDF